MAAAKLQYCDRMSNNMRVSFVNLLESNRRSFAIHEQPNESTSATQTIRDNSPEGGVASFESMRKMALEVAIGKTEAPASHEKVVVAVITIWVAIITSICFLDVEMAKKELIVGIAVNINLLFFYGAPLSTIFVVLKTKDSSSIHRWTMLMNTANATFWTAFGFGASDYFIMIPNGIGAVLGAVQMILCFIVPNREMLEENYPAPAAPSENIDLELTTKATPSDGSGDTAVSCSVVR